MQEIQTIPQGITGEELSAAVRMEVNKQIVLFAHYLTEDWELYGFDGPVEGSDLSPTSERSGQEAEWKIGPSVEPVEGRVEPYPEQSGPELTGRPSPEPVEGSGSSAVERLAASENVAGSIPVHSSEPVSSPGSVEYSIRQGDTRKDVVLKASASSQLAPWEVDDGRLGGESGEGSLPDVAEVESNNSAVARDSAPATEPAKEQQPKVRVMGNVARQPTFRPADDKRKAYFRFPLAEHPEPGRTTYHEVYATGRFAEQHGALELQPGEAVRVTGQQHWREKRDRNGRPLADANGEIQRQATIFAFGVKRVGKEEHE